MNDLFALAVHNTVVTLLFGLFVYGLTRVWRNPPVAHVLWLLVLLKLVAPPVLHVGRPFLGPQESIPAFGQAEELTPVEVHRPAASSIPPTPAAGVKQWGEGFAAGRRLFWNRGRPVLLGIWLAGAVACALVAVIRILHFQRLLRDTLPASTRLGQLAREVAGKVGVGRVPEVRYVDCIDVPLVWCAGWRPAIILPVPLFRQLDDQQAAMILAHELAHLRRRDHWVRAIELVVSVIYWWNPLVALIRRQIHRAEDLCCDAWVRHAFPDGTKRYAEVVLKAAESSSASKVGARLLPASMFLHSLSLKTRIEMILESRFAPSASARSMSVVALLALLVLPSFVGTTKAEPSRAESLQAADNRTAAVATGEAPASPVPIPKSPATSEFPYVVKFQQGATRFLEGDNITIVEIRGTADTFTRGNIYWIKGTYTLASHERATVAAYTTARNAAEGTSRSFHPQMANVTKGHGTFALFLPMSCEGWPHVSFYPADGGGDFGGNYFGTGDSVLKQGWWESDDGSLSLPAGTQDLRQLTIDKAYWPNSQEAPSDVRNLGLGRGERGGARIFWIHCREWLENAGGYLQYPRFMSRADKNFVLRAKGQPEVRCHVKGDDVVGGELRELSLIIPRAEYAKMAEGVAYTLHPVNAAPGRVWKVRDGVTLTRD